VMLAAWAIQINGTDGYTGLRVLENGDRLTVYTGWGAVLWQGVVDLEYQSGFIQYPGLPVGAGFQRIWDQTFTGCQRGVPLGQWAAMFMGPQAVPRRNLHGTLTWVPSTSRVSAKSLETDDNDIRDGRPV
jgi:hypothetical protein